MIDLIADSSFYLCFLDDIKCPDDLSRIIDNFTAHLSPRVDSEIQKSGNYKKISNHKNLNIFRPADFEIGELVRPFFSKDEVNKGEHEIVIVAYFTYNLKNNLVLIIDDKSPRIFIEKNFDYLTPFLTGTVGMIGKCFYTFNIFNKNECLSMLDKIESSKFRVNSEIIIKIKKKVLAS